MIPNYAIAVKKRICLDRLGSTSKVGKRSEDQVMAVWSQAGRGGKELELQVWVRPDYRGYRGAWVTAWKEAWEAALETRLVRKERKLIIEPGYEIDHLFPRSWAIEFGYEYVRLTELPAAMNRLWSNTVNKPTPPIPDVYCCDDLVWRKWLMGHPTSH